MDSDEEQINDVEGNNEDGLDDDNMFVENIDIPAYINEVAANNEPPDDNNEVAAENNEPPADNNDMAADNNLEVDEIENDDELDDESSDDQSSEDENVQINWDDDNGHEVRIFQNLLINGFYQRPNTDDEEEDDNDDDGNPGEEENLELFDASLPRRHLYLLRSDNEENNDNNRTDARRDEEIAEDNEEPKYSRYSKLVTVRLPVLDCRRRVDSLHLLPSQQLPLRITSPSEKNVITAALRTKLKSFLCFDLRESGPLYGCVLRIQEFYDTDDVYSVVAVASERFRLLDVHAEISGVVIADVELLPDVTSHSPLHSSCLRLNSLNRHMFPTITEEYRLENDLADHPGAETNEFLKNKQLWRRKRGNIMKVSSVLTRYPDWVYRQCDKYHLAERIRPYLQTMDKKQLTTIEIPKSPDEVCKLACVSLPLQNAQRTNIIRLDCVHQRLHLLLSILEKWKILVCKTCRTPIAKNESLIIVSAGGTQNAYVNPNGYVHEMMTVSSCTSHLRLSGPPTVEHSWFPGYSWTIMSCGECYSHMGWKFTAVRPSLRPKKFFGLTRSSIIPL